VGLSLASRDLAQIGYLYLNMGTWDGTEIVPADWVASSTSVRVPAGKDMPVWKNYGGSSLGYLWWVAPFKNSFFVVGHNGQSITVMPDQDMVVVITAEVPLIESGSAPETAELWWPLITDYIMPAVK
jgi:CubicO group peptidase (beta-lactamase class C family)